MKKYAYKKKYKQNYNETALATIAIVLDDGPNVAETCCTGVKTDE
jgi:hypothetical protein